MRNLEEDLAYLNTIYDSHKKMDAILEIGSEILKEEADLTDTEAYWYSLYYYCKAPGFFDIESLPTAIEYMNSVDSVKKKLGDRIREVHDMLWPYWAEMPPIIID